MINSDTYFFDIDGTLLVTRDLVHWNGLHQAMLEVYGVDTTIEGIPYHGKTDVAILRMALNRCGITDSTFYEKLPSALAVVCREVSANVAGILPEVCPAVPQLLSEIAQRSKLLGIASGNLESVGWSKVSAAGLREFFTVGSFGDRCELRAAIFANAVNMAKEQLGNSATVCFIGDTPDDIQAAHKVNANVIAVASGSFTFRELANFNPDVCCESCAELTGKLN
jgi:phosphoglycolate phosphatase